MTVLAGITWQSHTAGLRQVVVSCIQSVMLKKFMHSVKYRTCLYWIEIIQKTCSQMT